MNVAIILAGPYRGNESIIQNHNNIIGNYDTYASCLSHYKQDWLNSGWKLKNLFETPHTDFNKSNWSKYRNNEPGQCGFWQFWNLKNVIDNTPNVYDWYIKSRCDLNFTYGNITEELLSNLKPNTLYCPKLRGVYFQTQHWDFDISLNDQFFIGDRNVMNVVSDFVINYYNKSRHELNHGEFSNENCLREFLNENGIKVDILDNIIYNKDHNGVTIPSGMIRFQLEKLESMNSENKYTQMQKRAYSSGTSNHEEHNNNEDYWDILLGDLKNKTNWDGKVALDFACGKGRNVSNMLNLCDWDRVDGIDLSIGNINHNKETYKNQNSGWYCNNGIDVSELMSNEYDFIMSTIALQHIPVYDIRKSLITDLLRTLKPGGLFSFQMGYGNDLKSDLGPRSSYFENCYEADGTNSAWDVRVQNEQDVIKDLSEMGFVNTTTTIRESYSDWGHPHWIYVKAYKPK